MRNISSSISLHHPNGPFVLPSLSTDCTVMISKWMRCEGDFYWYQKLILPIPKRLHPSNAGAYKLRKSNWKFHSAMFHDVHEAQKKGERGGKAKAIRRNYWLCETCKALTSSYFNGNLIARSGVRSIKYSPAVFVLSEGGRSPGKGWKEPRKPRHDGSETEREKDIRCHPFRECYLQAPVTYIYVIRNELLCYVNVERHKLQGNKNCVGWELYWTLDLSRVKVNLKVYGMRGAVIDYKYR